MDPAYMPAAKRSRSAKHDGHEKEGMDVKNKGKEKMSSENDENKLGFDKEDEKPAEISEFEKVVDMCWDELNMYLYSEDKETDSSLPKIDTDDHSKSETADWATLCSQGKHPDLYLDEQVGLVCNCCSVVVEEIRHIFPPFSKNFLSSRRRDG